MVVGIFYLTTNKCGALGMATSKKKSRKAKRVGVVARMADGRVLLLSTADARLAVLTKRNLQAKLAAYRLPTRKKKPITTLPPLPVGWGEMNCFGKSDWLNKHVPGEQWNRALFEYFDTCPGYLLNV